MVTNVSDALQKVKDQYDQFIPASAIVQICRLVGHPFRRRMLGPVETVYLLLVQILHGNTACSHLRHLTGVTCSVSAYCRARARLPVEVLRRLLRLVCQSVQEMTDISSRWHGHRVFHVDGSSFSMPDTAALQEEFGQPGGQRKGCGFPTAHLLAMFDATTGLLVDILAAPLRTHEMAKVATLHPQLRTGDVLVADRGFCSYVHLALLLQRQLHGVFRIHQRVLVNFRPGRAYAPRKNKKAPKGLPRSKWLRCLGVQDQVIRWFKPLSKPRWITAEAFGALADSIVVRELRYQVQTPGYRTRQITLVTTLVDAEHYSIDDLADLYCCRWQIEVNLRHIKQTMQMDVLHCQTPDGVRKEMLTFALVYNLVCRVILAAADAQGVPPDRISFVDALRWLRAHQRGAELILLIINPRRSGRFEPRVVKRRPKQYPLMREPRHVLRNKLRQQ